MTLADRLNIIIEEQKLSKAEFARRLDITANYVFILAGNTGSSEQASRTLSLSLANLIALEFGYSDEWILNGVEKKKASSI